MGPLQWGDVPTAVGALFAGGAAWFAFQTIKSQRQQIGEQRNFIEKQLDLMDDQRQNLELERTELRAQATERRIAQARDITMRFSVAGSTGIDEYGEEAGFDCWDVVVTNGSRDPIQEVLVRFGSAYNAASASDHRSPYPDDGARPVPVPLIPSGGEIVFTSPRWSEATVVNNRPSLLFTDSNGVRWSLNSYKELEEAPVDGAS